MILTLVSTIGNRVSGNGHLVNLKVIGKGISYSQGFNLGSTGGILNSTPQTITSEFEANDGESITIKIDSTMTTNFQPFSYIVKDEFENIITGDSLPVSSKNFIQKCIPRKEFNNYVVCQPSVYYNWSVADEEHKTNTFIFKAPIIPVNIENISTPIPENTIPEIQIIPTKEENKKSPIIPLLIIGGVLLL